jgi:hypothetical protein
LAVDFNRTKTAEHCLTSKRDRRSVRVALAVWNAAVLRCFVSGRDQEAFLWRKQEISVHLSGVDQLRLVFANADAGAKLY